MKCPKCGFNSFEYYDSCKKCSVDLIGYKKTYSISSMVLPQEAKEKMAAEHRSNDNPSDTISATPEEHDDIFSFDLPEDSAPSPIQRNDDPFNFEESAPVTPPATKAKSEDDVFADLLESTSQTDDSPFSGQNTADVKTAMSSSSGPGEFDLDSFSWEEPSTTPPASGSADDADDFDSLFGDTKDNNSK